MAAMSDVSCWICCKPCELASCKVDEFGRAVHSECHLLRLRSLKDFSDTTHCRHQCVIYDGAPSHTLPALANVLHAKLKENYRCLYLNSPSMVAGMKCCLAAGGVDVSEEVQRGSLRLSADRTHLTNGRFNIDSMIEPLEAAVEQALKDGYKGLWATGDMSWEFGPQKDFARLLEYEWRLEQLFQKQSQLGGICQYHRDTLPPEVIRQGLLTHHSLFVNETLSRVNPQYVFQVVQEPIATTPPGADGIINQLCALQSRPEQ